VLGGLVGDDVAAGGELFAVDGGGEVGFVDVLEISGDGLASSGLGDSVFGAFGTAAAIFIAVG
jgi:hypothetical protein